jgi:hypothetical protein
MQKLSSLTNSNPVKEVFDPTKKEHLILYANFVKNKSWKHAQSCPFILEDKFETIPGMINHKIAMHTIENLV